MYAIVVESYGKYGNIVPYFGLYTKMCEMSPKQLANYVMCNHLDVL